MVIVFCILFLPPFSLPLSSYCCHLMFFLEPAASETIPDFTSTHFDMGCAFRRPPHLSRFVCTHSSCLDVAGVLRGCLLSSPSILPGLPQVVPCWAAPSAARVASMPMVCLQHICIKRRPVMVTCATQPLTQPLRGLPLSAVGSLKYGEVTHHTGSGGRITAP